ncbi:MAG: HEAT repeat domain-containing protein [Deltaproteobacteria bacterium]
MAEAVFDVRRGEYARVVRAGGAMFAILAGFTLSETARDSLFLGANGAGKLATAYLLLAGIAALAVAANAWLVRRVGRRAALVITLLLAAIGTALFYPAQRGPTIALVLYLWTGLIGTVVVIQFWLLAGTRFTSAEAKRLYGPIAASGAVGTLFGAVTAWALLRALEIETLLLVAAGFYVIAAALLARDNDSVESRLRGAQIKRRFAVAPSKLRGQGYAARLAVLTVCATAAALLADYLLKSAAAAAYRTDDLARFIARYNGTVAALSLVFQVVGTAWLVRKIGVLGMIVVLPILMLVGGAASAVTAGSFIAVCFTKGSDASLRYSVTRVATELLWMPVAENVRLGVREPLESVGTRLVQAITAAMLLALVALHLAHATVVAAILTGIAVVWTLTAARLRSRYLAQLRSSLGRKAFDSNHELDGEAAATVVDALSSDDDRRVIAAIQILVARGHARSIPAMLLRHDSIDVLTATLAALTTPGRTDWIPLTRKLLKSSDPRARTLALRALGRIGDHTAIFDGLCDDDPGVSAHGVFWSLQSTEPVAVQDNPAVVRLLAEAGPRGTTGRRELLNAIRSDGDQRWADVLLVLAFAGDDETFEPLVHAIEHVPDERFIPFLITRLGTRGGRARVHAALVAIGDSALTALELAFADLDTAPRVRLHIPSAIAVFGTPRAAHGLATSLSNEPSGAVRHRVLRAIARIATRDEVIVDASLLLAELRLHLHEHARLLALELPLIAELDARESAVLLRGLLRDYISQALDRAFLALQALHPREDIREIQRAIKGDDPRARAHATEFLDTLTRARLYAGPRAEGIRAQLLVLGEDLDARERLTRSGWGDRIPPSVAAAVTQLIRDPDTLLAACAGYFALDLRTPELVRAVDEAVGERPLFAPLGIAHPGLRVA